MKYYDLNPEEKKISADFDKDNLKSVKNLLSEKSRYKKIANSTLSKTRNINLRLSEKVLLKLKAKAVAMGLPYQTLAASILHQSVTKLL